MKFTLLTTKREPHHGLTLEYVSGKPHEIILETIFLLVVATHLQQRSSTGVSMVGQSWHASTLPQSSPAKQQQLRLQLLQLERDRLKQRQQEIRQQELRRQQEIMMRGTSTDLSMDPFLSGLTDHSRQESADSGLGMII